MTVLIATLASFLAVGVFVQVAKRYGWGKSIRKDGPSEHLAKAGTPTMGGVAFLTAASLVWIVFGEKSADGWAVVLLTLIAAAVGFFDDFLALRLKRRVASEEEEEDTATGLRARYHILLQVAVALAFAVYAVASGHRLVSPGWDMLVFTFFVVGAMNAMNFSDGLDGLAGGMSVLMLIPFFSVPFAAALIGGVMGFLWFNLRPAKVFMGGVGSEGLGAALAGFGIVQGWYWWIFLLGLIPALEVISVMLQVTYFRFSGGKRLFKMTPIHHHFELSGWTENQVVIRFWIITAVCVALAWSLRGGS